MKNFNFLLIGALIVIGASLYWIFGVFLGTTGIIIIELIILAAIIFLLVRYSQERKKGRK